MKNKSAGILGQNLCLSGIIMGFSILFLGVIPAGCRSETPADSITSNQTESAGSPLRNDNQERVQFHNVAVLGDSQSTGGYGQRLFELIRYTAHQWQVLRAKNKNRANENGSPGHSFSNAHSKSTCLSVINAADA